MLAAQVSLFSNLCALEILVMFLMSLFVHGLFFICQVSFSKNIASNCVFIIIYFRCSLEAFVQFRFQQCVQAKEALRVFHCIF